FKASQEYNRSVHHINVMMMSKMNIICPNVATNFVNLDNPVQKEHLFENFWFVDKESFESCKVNRTITDNQILLKCDEPVKLKYRELTLKPLSPVKGDPEFQYGKEYYFIATSNGSENSLENEAYGRCKTHNMKFKIYICTDQNGKCTVPQVALLSEGRPPRGMGGGGGDFGSY
ncbi:hypothetical protein QZH41_016692, partial [Actinostola sp. cb2023]